MADAPTARRDGFRERGANVTRTEAFVDAAFAFAVTLLVIALDKIPDSAATLVTALKRIPAFAASFALIALFWHEHHVWSRRFGLDGGRGTLLSLLLVFLVLIYVFPLRLLFAAFFSWISGGWLPSDYRITSLEDLRLMYVVYGVAFGSLGLTIVALNAHALSQRERLGLAPHEVAGTRREIAAWLLAPITAAASVGAALALRETWPQALFGIPGLLYCGMGLTGLAGRIVRG